MFNIFSFEHIKQSIKIVLSRFFVSFLLLILIVSLFFSLVHFSELKSIEDNLIRGVLSSIIAFFLSVGVYIFSEAKDFSKSKSLLLQIFPILFGTYFYFEFDQNIDNFENLVFFCLSLAGIISFLFFAPYVGKFCLKQEKVSVYYTYFYNISVVFLTSMILGGVMFVLGYIAIAVTFQLFDITWGDNYKLLGDWAVLSLSFFAPFFALSSLPDKKSFNESYFNENVFFSFIIKYIATPFIYVYFIILYAYSIKVLSNFGEWPKGEVAWMVIGFSIFGYLVYIFSYIFEGKYKLISIFRKIFPYAVIPQIFMLAYAIYLRIYQYDLTINRYFVVVFGLWLFCISLYFIFSKEKKLSSILATLTLFTILISVGPWSVYSLPEKRQLNLLKQNLIKAKILVGEDIIPLKDYTQIDEKLSGNIYSGIQYLCDFSDCSSIKTLFARQYHTLLIQNKKDFEKYKQKGDKYTGPSKWEIINHITSEIKVQYNYKTTTAIETQQTFYFYMKSQENHFPIDIKGYSKIYRITDGKYEKGLKNFAEINLDKKNISLYENDKLIKEINIGDYLNSLAEKYKKDNKNELTPSEMKIENIDYKIFFNNITIINPAYKGEKNNIYTSADGFILIK